MIEFKVESVTTGQQDIIQFLDDRIYEYNSALTGRHDGKTLTMVIRDNGNKIIAGICGWAWAAVSEITFLWVKEEFRKNGLGKMLLKAAEAEIARQGGKTILIRSYAFQAPRFYERHGYEVLFVLDDFPEGYKCYNLVKRLK
jgi:ribosomal protein S18 acetylase RimI-like enzyme